MPDAPSLGHRIAATLKDVIPSAEIVDIGNIRLRLDHHQHSTIFDARVRFADGTWLSMEDATWGRLDT